MHHTAEIKEVEETDKGTWMKIFVPDSFLETQIERQKTSDKAYIRIRLDDKRIITAEQQKKYWQH